MWIASVKYPQEGNDPKRIVWVHLQGGMFQHDLVETPLLGILFPYDIKVQWLRERAKLNLPTSWTEKQTKGCIGKRTTLWVLSS